MFNMSKHFLIIFLETWRPGVYTTADRTVLRARSSFLAALFSRKPSRFSQQDEQEMPATPGGSGLEECSIWEAEFVKW